MNKNTSHLVKYNTTVYCSVSSKPVFCNSFYTTIKRKNVIEAFFDMFLIHDYQIEISLEQVIGRFFILWVAPKDVAVLDLMFKAHNNDLRIYSWQDDYVTNLAVNITPLIRIVEM